MKIVFSVLNFLNYDEEISKELDRVDNEGGQYNKDVVDKTWYYGDYLLSASLLNKESYSNGTCMNYSAIFEAICTKLGIEAHMIGGKTLKSMGRGHEWNYVKIDDEYYLIDLTAINNSCTEDTNIYNMYFSKYMKEQEKGIDDKEIMNIFIDRIFNYYSDYMYENYYSEDNDEEILAPFDDTINVEYYNNTSDNEIHDVDYILSMLVGSISGMAVAIPSSLIKNKKNKYGK